MADMKGDFLQNDSIAEKIVHTQTSVILVLGTNLFTKKSAKSTQKFIEANYEIISLKYLPSICQIDSLLPDAVIVNLQGQKDDSLKYLISLSNEIREKYGSNLPLIFVVPESMRKQFKDENFEHIWNTSISIDEIYIELSEILKQSREQKILWKTLQELEEFKNIVHKEFEQASLFQSALFSRNADQTNLKAAYHYVFQNEIGGDFFRIFNLSASHVGLLIGDVRGRGASAALLTGFLLGQLHNIAFEKQRTLWEPSELLSYLSESIYIHNQNNGDLCATVWYGVIDLSDGKLEFARAGQQCPLFIDPNLKKPCLIDGGSGFPLGIFPGMTYRNNEIHLPDGSQLLLYTDGFINQKDNNNTCLNLAWLQNCFERAYSNKVSLEDMPQFIDKAFLDLVKEAEISDDRMIVCCELKVRNKRYVSLIPQCKEISSEAQASFSALIEETIDTIMDDLPSVDLTPDISCDFELALNELIHKAIAQVEKARLIAFEGECRECKAEGFTVCWWVHPEKLEISVRLDQCSIPWSYSSHQENASEEDLDSASSLILFFDNIKVNCDGLEISMTKAFG